MTDLDLLRLESSMQVNYEGKARTIAEIRATKGGPLRKGDRVKRNRISSPITGIVAFVKRNGLVRVEWDNGHHQRSWEWEKDLIRVWWWSK